ncbi:LOW QUALITY PROTEIN: receptor-type tyrosine-protein phosphatase-like N [Myripristis murdjan]|uniref:LOW QUALITY PROTEIN: receptor-type tyrosine-protein phosphatase-like N n=1 Tax=Myripristis murdjan TaxID=586833 RepID=UPI00117628A8|nr:LOW QUALITY PROTEIN: receptor-type tyrosine-protein phosphatase-like N [Myripristis murdjan]
MKSPRLWAALCLLITASYRLGTAARYGCLFEKTLCPRDQQCSDDGLFGQCQAPQQPPVQYQLSVPVLHKLQEVLRQLLMQGLTWQDDITQLVIGRELSQVPQIGPASKRHNKLSKQSSEARGPQGPEQPADPELMQQYLDYMVLDAPQSSIHMQRPLVDPYTYRQQKYGYQDEEERSLNSLDDNRAFPLLDSTARSGSRGNTLDRDRQLLQDLVSLYLSSFLPSSSSSSSASTSSSSPVQSLSRHRGAVAAAAGLPASSSSSSFFPELDFPLDYGEDYISQHAQVSEPQQEERAEKKAQKDYDSLGDLDERSLQKLAVLLEHYGLDMKDLTPEQMDNLPAALKQLQLDSSYFDKNTKDKYRNNAGTQKKIAEASMTYKIDKSPAAGGVSSGPAIAPDAPPSPAKSPKLGAPPAPLLKETPPTAPAKEEKQGKKEPAAVTKAEEYGYIVTNQSPLSLNDGVLLLQLLAERIRLSTGAFTNISVVGPALTFRLRPNSLNLTAEDVASKAVEEKNFLESKTGLKILQSGVGERNDGKALPLATRVQPGSRWVFATLVAVACVGGILVAAMTIACLRHHAHRLAAEKLGLGPEGGAITHQEYQDLCRQHMASKGAFGRLEAAALGAVGGSGGGGGAVGGGGGGGGGTDTSRVSSVSSQFSDGAQASPSSHSSTPSWCEEPAQANMDISTGHMILAYMEDHLRNKDRLMKEWEALCSYQAEPSAVSVAQSEANAKKNRCPDSVPYDHSRVKLKAEINPSRADYINASTIIEHDPRMPAYIATQGPLSHTISDFWQMVWENGCTVIVMMTALVEDGEKQCDRYWPDEGSSLYHIYEVNLVSEHIWCNDFLVRSFYLKNVQTQETRTLTQFHFLSWPAQGIPTSTRPLLDFRRKVNKCYRGRSCPIIVHCSDGTGRTGTYILIDMVLNRMAKGVKEIDIAATLEHVRDQRPGMVRTKDQFEFALTAVAEEVNAILKALPQ